MSIKDGLRKIDEGVNEIEASIEPLHEKLAVARRIVARLVDESDQPDGVQLGTLLELVEVLE